MMMKKVLNNSYKYLPKGDNKAVWVDAGEEVDLPNGEVDRLTKKGYLSESVNQRTATTKGLGK
jgi:hypothetical protein